MQLKPIVVYVSFAGTSLIQRICSCNTEEEAREAIRAERGRDKTFGGLLAGLPPQRFHIFRANWEEIPL